MKHEQEHHPFFHLTFVEIYQIDRLADEGTIQQVVHTQLCHMILFVVKGKGDVYINNRMTKVNPKTVIVLLPGTIVKIRSDMARPLTLYRLSFQLNRIQGRSERQINYDQELSFPVTGKVITEKFARMLHLFQQIESIHNQMGESDPFRYQHHVQELFLLLLIVDPSHQESADDSIQRTLKHMQQHYSSNITLLALSRIAGMHPTYYSSLFKQRLGKSPFEYLNHLRMGRAKELMLASHDKMKNIARLTGFSDEFYFSRRFKASCGVAPTVYMRNHSLVRIASLSSPYTDHLLTLGVNPCIADSQELLLSEKKWKAPLSDGLTLWESTRKELISSKPDIILCKEHILTEARMYMGDIAPIITVPWLKLDCFDHLREIAKLTQKEKDANKWISLHESRAEKARGHIATKNGHRTVAICVITRSIIKMYGGRNIGHVFYRSLQLAPPDIIRQEMAKHRAGTVFNWMAVTPEQFGSFEADYLFILVEPKAGAADKFAELQKSCGWKRHPAILAKRVYPLNWRSWVGYSPFSINSQLDYAVELLSTIK